MRNVNIFRTHVTDHIIPSEIMRRAIVLSPGKDWTDHGTEAYKYLKRWALEQDERYPKPKKVENPPKYEDELLNQKILTINLSGPGVEDIAVVVPPYVSLEAQKLSPGKDISDKRTKAYKSLKKWALEQDNNENSK